MNRQQMFDTIAEHLLRQGERSIGERGCAYRGYGGLRCSIGCLIPNEYYDPRFEGSHYEEFGLPRRLVPDGTMADCLRQMHDGTHMETDDGSGVFALELGDWPAALIDYAECNDLDPVIVYRTLEECHA